MCNERRKTQGLSFGDQKHQICSTNKILQQRSGDVAWPDSQQIQNLVTFCERIYKQLILDCEAIKHHMILLVLDNAKSSKKKYRQSKATNWGM